MVGRAGGAGNLPSHFLCAGCGDGEGRVAPVQAKRSLAPLLSDKNSMVLTHFASEVVSGRSPGPDGLETFPESSQRDLRALGETPERPQRVPRNLPEGLQKAPSSTNQ